MNIGKAAPPQTLPISASIPLSHLPSNPTDLMKVCDALEASDLLKNAVGISMETLYLTAHLGSEQIRDQLTKSGFTIDRHQVFAYVLSKNHDTAPITAKSLCDELVSLKANSLPALTRYGATTDMASLPGILEDKLSKHLMRLVVPSHTLSLAAVFPMKNTLAKLSFDTLFLGSYARGQHRHKLTLQAYLEQELGFLDDMVTAVFPDLAPAFKVWSTAYVPYLLDRIAQDGVAEAVVKQVTEAGEGEPEATPAPPSSHGQPPSSTDDQAAPAETLKEKLSRLHLDEGILTEEGPLSQTFDVEQTASHTGVVSIKRRQPTPLRAWCIPHLPPRGDEMVSVPYWAVKNMEWDFNTGQVYWLVYDGSVVEMMTDVRFNETFEITS